MEMVDSVDELKSSRSIEGKDSRISKCLTPKQRAWLGETRQARPVDARARTGSALNRRNRKLRKRIGFFEEDRSFT